MSAAMEHARRWQELMHDRTLHARHDDHRLHVAQTDLLERGTWLGWLDDEEQGELLLAISEAAREHYSTRAGAVWHVIDEWSRRAASRVLRETEEA